LTIKNANFVSKTGVLLAPRVRETLTGIDVPVQANSGFKDFCRDMFEPQVKEADRRAVFTEYASDMNWCDPCDVDPLSFEELCSLGVWLNKTPPDFIPGRGRRPIMPPMGGARDFLGVRMHGRYDGQHRPEDETNMGTASAGNGKRWQYSRPVNPAAA
jgi:hypothetical protein